MPAAQADNEKAFGSLPPSLAARGFALRSETDADIAFFRRLYASTRVAEIKLTNWSDAQKLVFTDNQFGLQRHHYRTYYPATEWSVLRRLARGISVIFGPRIHMARRPPCNGFVLPVAIGHSRGGRCLLVVIL